MMLPTLVCNAPHTGIGNFATKVGCNERLDRSATTTNNTDLVLGEDLHGSLAHISGQQHSDTFGL